MANVHVIDDSFSVCMAVERALSDRGHHVAQDRSAKVAMARLAQRPPDLVLCDLVLPDGDGLEVCTFVKSHPALALVPVLMISGSDDEALLGRIAAVGGDGLLRKPFSGEALGDVVHELLEGRLREIEPDLDALDRALRPVDRMASVALASVVDRVGRGLVRRGRHPGDLEPERVESLLRGVGTLVDASRLGPPVGATIELESGLILTRPLAYQHHLVLLLSDPLALGQARHLAQRLAREINVILRQPTVSSASSVGPRRIVGPAQAVNMRARVPRMRRIANRVLPSARASSSATIK